MTHKIEKGVYYICDDKDEIVMSIELDNVLNQVTISTPQEVYSGPIELISFKEDIKGEENDKI